MDRLWVISELYYPEETSTGYYLTRIAEGLADDFDVRVICGQPTYSLRGTRSRARETHKKVEIFRAAGTTFDKNVIAFRLLNMLTLGASIFVKAVMKFRAGDTALVVTTPPSMPFVVAMAALLRGSSYTLLIHDNYPEILVAVGKTQRSSILFKVNEFANRWLFKHASKIIAVGRDMHELLTEKTVGLDVPVVTIPNWAELETVGPLPRSENALLKELGLTDRFVLLYAGNMGRPNDLETIVAGAEQLMVQDPKFHFIFLGAGAKRKWLESTVAEKKLGNITILDPRPRANQPTFLNACDVAIVSLVSQMRGVSMPSRTYNAIAAGKPILALTESGSEVARMIGEDEIGWIVPPGDVGGFVAAVREAANAPNRLAEMGTRARKAAVGKYSLEAALKSYRRALKREPRGEIAKAAR